MAINWRKSTRFSSPVDSPGFMLWQVFHAWKRQINATLEPFGLTQLQFSLLACLGWLLRDSETVTQKQLASFTSIDKMQVSQVMGKLDSAGFIERLSNQADRRAWSLVITPRGEDVLTRALVAVETSDARFFDDAEGAAEMQQFLSLMR